MFDCETEPLLPGLKIRTEMLLLLGFVCVEDALELGRLAGSRGLLDGLDRLRLGGARSDRQQDRDCAQERDQLSFHDCFLR